MSLEQRIEELERQNRRIKRAGLLTVVGVLAATLLYVGLQATSRAIAQGRTESKVIEATEFRLVDRSGKLRAALGMANGEPGLVLYDKDGKARASLELGKNGEPALTLYDKDGKARADLHLDERGAFLNLVEENGKSLATLGVGKSPEYGEVLPLLALTDHSGTMRALVQVEKERPSLLLFDRDGKRRAGLGVYEDGPKIRLTDEDGQVTWGAP